MTKTDPRASAHFIRRFRLWGIRALNWELMPLDWKLTQADHLEDTTCAPWLDAAAINIVIGPNGGGKTTTLDVIRAISDPTIWPSLPRENPEGKHFSGFHIEGNDWQFRAEFDESASAAKDAKFRIRQFAINLPSRTIRGWMPLYGKSGAKRLARDSVTAGWESKIREAFTENSAPLVHFCPSPSQQPEEDNPAILDILNEIWPSLHGVEMAGIHKLNIVEPPFRRVGKATRIAVALEDSPTQRQHLDVKDLPLGWRHFAHVVWSLRQAPRDSIVVLDEPDRVLHPKLQRRLLMEIATIAIRQNQQIFISTHSPALINPSLTEPLGAAVFQAKAQRLRHLTDRRNILDDLGFSSSDLAHTNGIIWVEGPTDRIYLNKWLRLYAEHHQRVPWVEGINYQIAWYGGALLKYLSLLDTIDGPEQTVCIRSINRNFFLLMDKDFDEFRDDDDPDESNAKIRLRKQAQAISEGGPSHPKDRSLTWVTERYTVEDYLPSKRFGKWVTKKNGRTVIKGKKMALADRFWQEPLTWRQSYKSKTDLPAKIASLFKLIEIWQSDDEVKFKRLSARRRAS